MRPILIKTSISCHWYMKQEHCSNNVRVKKFYVCCFLFYIYICFALNRHNIRLRCQVIFLSSEISKITASWWFKCSYTMQDFAPMRFHCGRGQQNVLSYNAADCCSCLGQKLVQAHTYSDFITGGHRVAVFVVTLGFVFNAPMSLLGSTRGFWKCDQDWNGMVMETAS